MSNKSLSSQLSWRVGVIQLLTFIASIAILVGLTWTPSVLSVPVQVAKDVASAISMKGGQLELERGLLPTCFLEQEADAWVVAQSSSGSRLIVGDVPSQLIDLSKNIESLQETQIRSDHGRLAATVVVQKRGNETIRVLVGGVASKGLGEALQAIGQYVFLPMFMPVLIATALVIPWVIRRRLKGVRQLAVVAATINLNKRATVLDSQDIPSEVQPMVASFNQALSQIWESSSARDRFLADAAHELRMPMAVLRARLSSLPHSKDKIRLVGDLSRLETIAEQLLDLQRLDRSSESYRPLNLTELCDNLAAEVAPLILQQGYEFSFHADDEPAIVMGDAGSLERMLKNLLHNAITHGGHGGSISFEAHSDGRVKVTDSGPGIPYEDRQRIFAPFYRLNSAISGSGLGLHLANEVASKHGGRIRVTDSESGGASFEVVIPTVAVDDTHVAATKVGRP